MRRRYCKHVHNLFQNTQDKILPTVLGYGMHRRSAGVMNLKSIPIIEMDAHSLQD